MNKKYTLTILGLGNILLRDEGFGVHFVHHFQEKYQVPESIAVIDGGTLGYVLMDIICETEYLLVIDTVRAEGKPGSMYRFSPDDVPACLDYRATAHEVEFLDILLKAEMLGEAPKTTILAVTPEEVSEGAMELTPTVQDSLSVMEDLVKEEIENLGMFVQPFT